MREESDELLMKALAGKDRSALQELMRRHEARVRRLAYRFTGSDDAAAELVQDVFFKIYTSAGSYSPKARFTTWLYRITANHCLNYNRNSRKNPVLHNADPLEDAGAGCAASSPADQLSAIEQHERALRIRGAVESLPERQRLAILLLRFEDMSYRDAADALGCSVSALEALVNRGLASLRKQLSDLYQG